MPFLILSAVSLLIGSLVYLATVRGDQGPETTGFGQGAVPEGGETAGGPGPGYAYLRVSTEGPSISDRLQGIVGLVLLIVVSAAALAFAIYQAGHMINSTIESFVGR